MSKLSYTTMATPEQSGIEAIQLARKYGFQGVDMRVGANKSELDINSSTAEINALKYAFDAEGILPSGLLCYIQAPIEDLTSWCKMQDRLLRCLEIAYHLGSPSIRIWLPSPKNFEDPILCIEKSAETLNIVLEKDQSNVDILVQNHRKQASALETAKIIRKANNVRLGLVFSPEHCVGENEDIEEVYKSVKPFTRQLYIADIKVTESGQAVVLPGKGDAPILEAYKLLGGKDFKGWVTFKWEKIWERHLEEPEIALPHFIEYFRIKMRSV